MIRHVAFDVLSVQPVRDVSDPQHPQAPSLSLWALQVYFFNNFTYFEHSSWSALYSHQVIVVRLWPQGYPQRDLLTHKDMGVAVKSGVKHPLPVYEHESWSDTPYVLV